MSFGKIIKWILKKWYVLLIIPIDIGFYYVFVYKQMDILRLDFIGYSIEPFRAVVLFIPFFNGLIAGLFEENERRAQIWGGFFGIVNLFYDYTRFFINFGKLSKSPLFRDPRADMFFIFFVQLALGVFCGMLGFRIREKLKKRFTKRYNQ